MRDVDANCEDCEDQHEDTEDCDGGWTDGRVFEMAYMLRAVGELTISHEHKAEKCTESIRRHVTLRETTSWLQA